MFLPTAPGRTSLPSSCVEEGGSDLDGRSPFTPCLLRPRSERGGTWQQSTCGGLCGTAARQPACHFHFKQLCRARFEPYIIYVTCVSASSLLPAVHSEGADLCRTPSLQDGLSLKDRVNMNIQRVTKSLPEQNAAEARASDRATPRMHRTLVSGCTVGAGAAAAEGG